MSAYPKSSTFLSQVRFKDECFVNVETESFRPSDCSYDVASRWSYPAVFLDFVNRCAEGHSSIGMKHLVTDCDFGPIFDEFHTRALQLLSLFGLFPVQSDNIREDDLMDHGMIMEKKLNIALENADDFTFHKYKKWERQSRHKQALILLFNCYNGKFCRVWRPDGVSSADLMRAPIILVYSDTKARLFQPSDFKFFTRKISNKTVPNAQQGCMYSLIDYVLDNGKWWPCVVEKNLLSFLGQRFGQEAKIREDELLMNFRKVMKLGQTEVIGYFGDIGQIYETLFESKPEDTKFKEFVNQCQRPSLMYYDRGGKICLFFVVPAVQFLPKEYWFPGGSNPGTCPYVNSTTREAYFDCAVHAYRFMQSVCERVEVLLSPAAPKRETATAWEHTLSYANDIRYYGTGNCVCIGEISQCEPVYSFDSLASLLAWCRRMTIRFDLQNDDKIRFHKRNREMMSVDVSGEVFSYVRSIMTEPNLISDGAVVKRLSAYEDGSITITMDEAPVERMREVKFASVSQLDVGCFDYFYSQPRAIVRNIPGPEHCEIINAWALKDGVLTLWWWKPNVLSVHFMKDNYDDRTVPDGIGRCLCNIDDQDLVQASYSPSSNVILVSVIRPGKEDCRVISLCLNQEMTKMEYRERGLYQGFTPLARFPPKAPPKNGKYHDVVFGGAILNEAGSDGVMIFNKQRGDQCQFSIEDKVYIVRFDPIELRTLNYWELTWNDFMGQTNTATQKMMPTALYISGLIKQKNAGSCISSLFPLYYNNTVLDMACIRVTPETLVASSLPFCFSTEKGALEKVSGSANVNCDAVQLAWKHDTFDLTMLCCEFPHPSARFLIRSDIYGHAQMNRVVLDDKSLFSAEIVKVFMQAIQSYGLSEVIRAATPYGDHSPLEYTRLCLRQLDHANFNAQMANIISELQKQSPVPIQLRLVNGDESGQGDLFPLFIHLCCLPRLVVGRPFVNLRSQLASEGISVETFTQRCKEFPVFPFLRMTSRMKSFVVAAIGEDVAPLLSHLMGTQFFQPFSGTLAIGSNPIPIFTTNDFVNPKDKRVKEDAVDTGLVNAISALFTIEQGKFSHAIAFLLAVANCETVIVKIEGGRDEFREFFSMVVACIDLFYFKNGVKFVVPDVLVLLMCDLGDNPQLGQAMIEEDISNLLNERRTPMARKLADVCRFQLLPSHTDTLTVASRLQTETGFLTKLITERAELRATGSTLENILKMAALFGNQIDFEENSHSQDCRDVGRPDMQRDDLEQIVAIAEKYRTGAGLHQNQKKAIELLQLAADRGDTKAQFILGTEEWSPPLETADDYLARAALVDPIAKYELYKKTGDEELLKGAARGRHFPALMEQARLANGKDFGQWMKAIVSAYTVACKGNNDDWNNEVEVEFRRVAPATIARQVDSGDLLKLAKLLAPYEQFQNTTLLCFALYANKTREDMFDVIFQNKNVESVQKLLSDPERQFTKCPGSVNELTLHLLQVFSAIDKDGVVFGEIWDTAEDNVHSNELAFIRAIYNKETFNITDVNLRKIPTFALLAALKLLPEQTARILGEFKGRYANLTVSSDRSQRIGFPKGTADALVKLGDASDNDEEKFEYYFKALQIGSVDGRDRVNAEVRRLAETRPLSWKYRLAFEVARELNGSFNPDWNYARDYFKTLVQDRAVRMWPKLKAKLKLASHRDGEPLKREELRQIAEASDGNDEANRKVIQKAQLLWALDVIKSGQDDAAALEMLQRIITGGGTTMVEQKAFLLCGILLAFQRVDYRSVQSLWERASLNAFHRLCNVNRKEFERFRREIVMFLQFKINGDGDVDADVRLDAMTQLIRWLSVYDSDYRYFLNQMIANHGA